MVSTELPSKLSSYSEVFGTDLGTIKSTKVKLQLKENADPNFVRPRPIPFELLHRVKEELDRLEGWGILKKVQHSNWVAQIVVVDKKEGGIRFCGDYKVALKVSS